MCEENLFSLLASLNFVNRVPHSVTPAFKCSLIDCVRSKVLAIAFRNYIALLPCQPGVGPVESLKLVPLGCNVWEHVSSLCWIAFSSQEDGGGCAHPMWATHLQKFAT